VARNEIAELLKREIGLAPGQKITLSDPAPYSELAAETPEEVRAIAYRNRQDYQNLQNQAVEYKAIRSAYRSQRMPTLSFGGYYGVSQVNGAGSHGNFAAVGTLSMPLFREAKLRGDTEAAQAQMDAFNVHQAADDPLAQAIKGSGYHTIVRSLHEDHVHTIKPTLVLLQCGVLFLLLIGSVNLVNLLLIRASGRTKELAIRQALGAGSRQIALGVIVETTLLSFCGGILGLLVGAFGIAMLRSLGTDQLPLGASIVFDGRLAAVALAAAIAVGLLLAAPIIWFNLHAQLARKIRGLVRT